MEHIITLLIGIVLGFAAPIGRFIGDWIKEHINSIKHYNLQEAAWVLVRYAEKELSENHEKFNYVYNRLVKKFPWASNDKIGEFITTAVDAMKKELGNGENSPTSQ